MERKKYFIKIFRIFVACIFATGVAFSDTLKSAVQYSSELESKHSSINIIKEDSALIESALKDKAARAIKHRLEFSGREISAVLPSAPKVGLHIQITPYGTLSPQGSSSVIDRGFNEDKARKE